MDSNIANSVFVFQDLLTLGIHWVYWKILLLQRQPYSSMGQLTVLMSAHLNTQTHPRLQRQNRKYQTKSADGWMQLIKMFAICRKKKSNLTLAESRPLDLHMGWCSQSEKFGSHPTSTEITYTGIALHEGILETADWQTQSDAYEPSIHMHRCDKNNVRRINLPFDTTTQRSQTQMPIKNERYNIIVQELIYKVIG